MIFDFGLSGRVLRFVKNEKNINPVLNWKDRIDAIKNFKQ